MKSYVSFLGFALVLILTGCGGTSSSTTIPPPLPPSPPSSSASPDARADDVVSQMTMDEKLQMVHGGAANDWWAHTLPRAWPDGFPVSPGLVFLISI